MCTAPSMWPWTPLHVLAHIEDGEPLGKRVGDPGQGDGRHACMATKLLQELGHPAVGQRLAAGLAGGAVLQRRVGEGHLAHHVTAHRAREAGAAVHGEVLFFSPLRSAAARPRERSTASPRTLRIASYNVCRRSPSMPDDGRERRQLARRAAARRSRRCRCRRSLLCSRSTPLTWARPAPLEDLLQHLDGEVVGERVGTQACDAGHLLRVADDVDGQPLLGAGLGDVEPGVVVEDAPARRAATCCSAAAASSAPRPPADPPGAGEVDHQVQPGGADVEELPVPGDAVDDQPVEGGQRRVEGLQRAERRDVDAHDRTVGEPTAQVQREAFDLGELGHGSVYGGQPASESSSGRSQVMARSSASSSANADSSSPRCRSYDSPQTAAQHRDQLGHLVDGQPERPRAGATPPQRQHDHVGLGVPGDAQPAPVTARVEEDLADVGRGDGRHMSNILLIGGRLCHRPGRKSTRRYDSLAKSTESR